MIRRFARPYARAIFEVAGSPEKALAIRNELASFERARSSSKELSNLYSNPGVEADAKLKITRTIAQRLELSELSVRTLEVLLKNHRLNDLGAISEALAELINSKLGIVVAEVQTAHALNDTERAELQRTLETKVGKKVELRLSTDPQLLGGFVARIGSEIWDASVTGKIQTFRASLA